METKGKQKRLDLFLIATSLLLLTIVYVFQQWDYLNFMAGVFGASTGFGPTAAFIFNKTFRLIMNDALCFLLIYALFREKRYLKVAFLVFCFELFLMLPLYLTVKLSLEGSSEISSPLLSQIHRLVVNPMLMLILIVAFYYQRFWVKERKE